MSLGMGSPLASPKPHHFSFFFLEGATSQESHTSQGCGFADSRFFFKVQSRRTSSALLFIITGNCYFLKAWRV
jgi:hypothetical protein